MKCSKCGYYNKSENVTCERCGNLLEKSPITKYKKKASNDLSDKKTFSRTEKLIIALVTIGVLMLISSAMIPSDFDFSNLFNSENSVPEETTLPVNDTQTRIDTTIQITSAGYNTDEQVSVAVEIKDANNYPVNAGTASITINEVKYSGNVENGYANIIIPKTEENRITVTAVYEGNADYNPSQTTNTIEIIKVNTQIEVEENNNTIIATLKSANNEILKDSTVNILYSDNTSIEQKTDQTGRIMLDEDINPGINSIKLSYAGNEQYNPCEKIIELENNKINTKIEATFDEVEQAVTAKLLDENNNPMTDAELTITSNTNQTIETTNFEGTVTIPVDEGFNKYSKKYNGNKTHNPSETTLNTLVEENKTQNTTDYTDNETSYNTTNITEDTTTDNSTMENTTTNTTVVEDNSTISDNNTKINTTINSEVFRENSTIVINLTTEDNQSISGEYIKITLDNGTEIIEKTDLNGTIILDLDEFTKIDKMEFTFLGDENYSSSDDYIII